MFGFTMHPMLLNKSLVLIDAHVRNVYEPTLKRFSHFHIIEASSSTVKPSLGPLWLLCGHLAPNTLFVRDECSKGTVITHDL